MKAAFHLPINTLSLGQVSICLLRELYKRQLSPCIFPIGNVDLSSHKNDEDFNLWLKSNIVKSVKTYQKSWPSFKVWHLNGSLESLSAANQLLYTFYELDNPTSEELNIVANNKHVIFSSTYSKNIFSDFGANNVSSFPLGFDQENFFPIQKPRYTDDRIVFTLGGKFEKRKHHQKILKLWAKKYGNDRRYMLHCALSNSFMRPEDVNQLIIQALEGNVPPNMVFYNQMQGNNLFNEWLNAGHIDITGLSGAEGFNLVPFQQVAMGKFAVVLNAHSHKDWATEENSVLVNPKGKEPVYDGVFFHQGQPFNQGNIFFWDEEEVSKAMDKAVEQYKTRQANSNGLLLQEQFTYAKTLNYILDKMEV